MLLLPLLAPFLLSAGHAVSAPIPTAGQTISTAADAATEAATRVAVEEESIRSFRGIQQHLCITRTIKTEHSNQGQTMNEYFDLLFAVFGHFVTTNNPVC